MTSLSARLLSLLQLTRMALVFTAIADTLCALLLRVRMELPAGQAVLTHLDWRQVVAVVGMSVGLYGYGMSLNDIIDRRRDERLAAHRPLPSGRVGIISAHVVCTIMGLIAIAGGLTYMLLGVRSGWVSLVLVVWTALLITFYDVMGKYLVWPGLLTLGLVRFFHAVIPAPQSSPPSRTPGNRNDRSCGGGTDGPSSPDWARSTCCSSRSSGFGATPASPTHRSRRSWASAANWHCHWRPAARSSSSPGGSIAPAPRRVRRAAA
jgi:hypothetical protein